jgi:hypothetical protein
MCAFRTVIHQLYLTATQVEELVSVFDKGSEEALTTVRVDAFVSLYPRCVDIESLLVDVLYMDDLLDRIHVLTVRKRLGRLRTFDLTRIEREQLTPTTYFAVMATTMESRATESKLSKNSKNEIADQDAEKMKGVLDSLKILDDVTSVGNANRFVLDLEVFEDWQAALLIMEVADAEECSCLGAHFVNPKWTENRLALWLVPAEWQLPEKDVPQKGIFTVSYILEDMKYLDIEARRRLAQEFLGW